MTDVFLLLALVPFAVLGYVFMGRLDRALACGAVRWTSREEEQVVKQPPNGLP